MKKKLQSRKTSDQNWDFLFPFLGELVGDRAATFIRARYNLCVIRTFKETGERFEISTERARQIIEKARAIIAAKYRHPHPPAKTISASLKRAVNNLDLAKQAVNEISIYTNPNISKTSPNIKRILDSDCEEIELSSRASNCLKAAKIKTLRELVVRQPEELMAVKNFGKKSLDEIKDRLKDMGLSLGMHI